MNNLNKALDKVYEQEILISNLEKEKSIVTLEYTQLKEQMVRLTDERN